MSIQTDIINEMNTKPVIQPKDEIRKRIDFLKSYLLRFPSLNGFVLGISGGQDSTLAGKLAAIAVAELNDELEIDRFQFVAVRLPYGIQQDEDDCQMALDFIQPSETITINIKPAVDASIASATASGVSVSDFIKGNEKARERMKVQYLIAASKGLVVIGTDHSAEAVTGFFTKFGDGACDIAPLFGLNKRQGKMLLAHLGCPEKLYVKEPTADLEDDKPGLPDELALGVIYDEIDDYLEGKVVSDHARMTIEHHFHKTKHKREGVVTPS